MFLLSIGRSILFALQSFFRNIWLSVATVFIIFLAFLSINFLVAINAASQYAIDAVKNKIDVSVYFNPTIKEDKILEVKNHLETLSQVKELTYLSPEKNLAIFKQAHINDTVIQETIDELDGNPLGAILVVKAKQLTDYPEILKAIDNPAYAELIESKSYDDHQIVISRINDIANGVKKIGLIISGIFVVIAGLIVFNTVRIAIFTKQNEIGIMKLVGATNLFIRAPFIIESILSGIIACILAILAVYPILSYAQPYLNTFFEGANFNLIGYFMDNFAIIFGGELLGIIILNVASSAVAIGKYLRV